jgi:hypothetical protein
MHDNPSNIIAARRHVMKTYLDYSKQETDKRNIQTGFDSSIIALATGVVAAAFFRGSADLIGGLGLGGAAVTSYDKYYNPDGEGAIYIDAKKRLLCLLNTSQPFLIINPGLAAADAQAQGADQIEPDVQKLADHEASKAVSDKLNQAQSDLETQISQTVASTPAMTANPKTQAQINATNATVDAATSALNALKAEHAAYVMAAPTIWAGYNAILARVDSGMHRNSVSIGATEQDLTAGITQAGNQVASVAAARTQLISAIRAQGVANSTPGAAPAVAAGGSPAAQQTDALARATQNTIDTNLPNPLYTAILANIQQCTSGY